MKKIVFIGGGSAKFVREVVVDILSYPEMEDFHVTLMDIDRERLDRAECLVRRIIADRRLPAAVDSTLDQRRALNGADYVIVTVMVGGYDHYRTDVAIPARFGVLQSISDTIGPGGVFRIVRTSPVLQQMAKNLRELAPQAWILNYANPLAMNVWTLNSCGHARTVGLCHSIQSAYRQVAGWLGIPAEEVLYTAGGINHVNFYLTLTRHGRSLYPDLLARATDIIRKDPSERVRMELVKYLGYFPAEGPAHQSEYSPWFRKNAKMVRHYGAATFLGYKNDFNNFKTKSREIEDQIAGRKPISYDRSFEYGAGIIHSMESGESSLIYGNVPNHGLIENLPSQAMVEVPCMVSRNGIQPCRVGTIPPQLAAVMLPHIAVQEMAVRGALEKNRTLIRQAIQADPLSGAVLTLPEIEEMVNELFKENKAYAAGYR